MMNEIPNPAGLVVYRHPCDCSTASRPLAEGEEPEHRFDVDGQPFPWLTSGDHDEQTKFTRLRDDLYRVDVTILAIRSNGESAIKPELNDEGRVLIRQQSFVDQSLFEGSTTPGQPIIAGLEFPWLLSGDGVSYQRSHKMLPRIKLAFFARHVDADCEIPDERDVDQTIVDNGSGVWKESTVEAALWRKSREITESWPVGPNGTCIDASAVEAGVLLLVHPDGHTVKLTGTADGHIGVEMQEARP